MKIMSIILLLNLFLFAEINIITSNQQDFQNINNEKLSNIYLKKTTTINKKEVTPIDNIKNYNEFYKKVIKKNPQQIHAYWMKEIFTGKKRPPKKIAHSELNKELQNDTSAIGYSSSKSNSSSIKVIHEVQ